MKEFITELNAFYPAYIKAHSDKGNQVLHFIGATFFFVLVTLSIVLPNYWLIPVAIALGYILPGIGHRFFQHNDSFRATKPLLCVLCAFRLYIDTLTFRIHKKINMADRDIYCSAGKPTAVGVTIDPELTGKSI